MKLKFYPLFVLFITTIFIYSCNNSKKQENKEDLIKSTSENPPQQLSISEAIKTATIYEVNIRQYTPEGTINAFSEHLPRLKELGVDILWIMPIHPIGELNKKGEIGSFYAVKDYKAVNPDFGTLEDFKNLVKKAHDLGMFIILDWVANHTAPDNVWVKEHPDWYTQIVNGIPIHQENTDWTDVADLNYDNKEMRQEMINSLKFWIQQADIDGYRCDVAFEVPTDFWNEAAKALKTEKKDIFMLAEAEHPGTKLYDTAFDMCYAWGLHHEMNETAKGNKKAADLYGYYDSLKNKFPDDIIFMLFTSNHDENSWHGSVFKRMTDSYKTFAVFTYLFPGMPLIYSGQEVGLNRKLSFFGKDSINWDNDENKMTELYISLNSLKLESPALWNGLEGGKYTELNQENDNIFAFARQKNENTIIAIFNLSSEDENFNIKAEEFSGTYNNFFTKQEFDFSDNKNIKLNAWEYLILVKK